MNFKVLGIYRSILMNRNKPNLRFSSQKNSPNSFKIIYDFKQLYYNLVRFMELCNFYYIVIDEYYLFYLLQVAGEQFEPYNHKINN